MGLRRSMRIQEKQSGLKQCNDLGCIIAELSGEVKLLYLFLAIAFTVLLFSISYSYHFGLTDQFSDIISIAGFCVLMPLLGN